MRQLQRDGAALVLAHLPPGDADRVTPLVRSATAIHRPVPVLVVSDAHHPAQALDLLRRGVVDYLSRPLDLSRLGFLVDLLTVRTRYEARRAQAQGQAVEAGTGPASPRVDGARRRQERVLTRAKALQCRVKNS